jgi:hypothetical protein
MRYFTYAASAQLVRDLDIAGAVRRIVHDGGDIIHLELVTGQSLMIYLIESPLPLYEIKNILTHNTNQGHHTLFILWGALLLPDDRHVVEIEDWQDVLLQCYAGRIYAFEVHRGQLYLHAVYFDEVQAVNGSDVKRARIRHGRRLDAGSIASHEIHATLFGIEQTWRIAAFDGDPDYFHRERARKMAEPMAHDLVASYSLLRVSADADMRTVKQAYRQLALQYHPDTNANDPDATRQMQHLNQAYQMILKARQTDAAS